MKKPMLILLAVLSATHTLFAQTPGAEFLQVKTANGTLQGVDESGVRSFKGVPFAAPPVGKFRWREPQPVQNWTGIRKADKFGPRAVQLPLFGDMNFRSNGMSEDCLYLNVWTPAKSGNEKLPVLVYFYGGGLMAGDGSEPRYDGESMARRGIVSVTVNYRLSVFGFFSHPELTKESPNKASGNYGFLDQTAALQWVQKNIAAFGGDAAKVTIAGESAGSFSVSAQMASPLAKNLFAGAIGESGSLLGSRAPVSREEAEKFGSDFAKSAGAASLAALRAIPAETLIKATEKAGRFPVNVDGYFFTKSPDATYTAGEQAHVPLLVGWNSEEGGSGSILQNAEPTKANFEKAVQRIYAEKAADMLKYYQPANDDDVRQVATDLASDQFIAFGTWRWSDMQARTGQKPVFRYYYQRPRPHMRAEMGNAVAGLAGGVITGKEADKAPKTPPPSGASHSAEIEYALGNLPGNRVYDWQTEDFKVSEIMQAMFANFIKTGDPNGLGSPEWPAVKSGQPASVMHIDVKSAAETEKHRDRYLFLEKIMK